MPHEYNEVYKLKFNENYSVKVPKLKYCPSLSTCIRRTYAGVFFQNLYFTTFLFITLNIMCTEGHYVFRGIWSESCMKYVCITFSLIESVEIQDIVYNGYIQGNNLLLW